MLLISKIALCLQNLYMVHNVLCYCFEMIIIILSWFFLIIDCKRVIFVLHLIVEHLAQFRHDLIYLIRSNIFIDHLFVSYRWCISILFVEATGHREGLLDQMIRVANLIWRLQTLIVITLVSTTSLRSSKY